MRFYGKTVHPALSITLGAPKKCYREKFCFVGFFRTHQFDSSNGGTSNSRIKKKNVNSPFKTLKTVDNSRSSLGGRVGKSYLYLDVNIAMD